MPFLLLGVQVCPAELGWTQAAYHRCGPLFPSVPTCAVRRQCGRTVVMSVPTRPRKQSRKPRSCTAVLAMASPAAARSLGRPLES